MPRTGDILDGRYEIVGLLARGGMGEVYRARRRLLGDEVAIKVVQTAAGEPTELRERFMRESRACAQLRHPHIVSILDFDLDAEGRPFLVMELLNGPSLRDELRAHGRLPLATVQALVAPLASAIQLAHDRGVVHRDIKPANILSHRFETGEVVWKVVDFGLANVHAASEATRLTGAREFVGTATYAAPEQLRGEPVDRRADVYSFGAVVFEMLTGRPPFPDEDLLALVTSQLTAPPPPVSTLVPGLPGWVADAVATALQKDPSARWCDMSAFVRAFAEDGEASTTSGGAVETRPMPAGLHGFDWLPGYDVERSIGRGRLGSEIYAGRHRALGHPVAIRIVRRRDDVAWDAVRARFVQEARALQVAHPSVLQVRDLGESEDAIAVVTELVAGPSLRELLAREGPFEGARLGRLVRQMLEAAVVLQRRGALLCGVSPEIIRTTHDDDGERLLLSSAGISEVRDLLGTLSEDTLRGAGVLDPELPYVAPEVFLGRVPDARSDVFTLGVLMYELATGRLPFQASNMHQLLGAAMSVRPLDPRDLQPGLDDRFADTVLACLRADPEARPASAADVLGKAGG